MDINWASIGVFSTVTIFLLGASVGILNLLIDNKLKGLELSIFQKLDAKFAQKEHIDDQIEGIRERVTKIEAVITAK